MMGADLLKIVIILTGCTNAGKSNYAAVSKRKTWHDASTTCTQQNGRLAVIRHWDEVENSMPTNYDRDVGVWTSGKLHDQGWFWHTYLQGNERLIPTTSLVLPRGCHHAAYIFGGRSIVDLTAEKCFQECNWEGAVGLYSTVCLCERHLRNLTRRPDDECSIKCPGDNEQNCGGIRTISIYQQSSRAIRWANEYPQPGDECAFMKVADDSDVMFWYSTDCVTHMRYLCQFENSSFCGESYRCIRPSTKAATWEGARYACSKLGGNLATITIPIANVDDDVKSVTSGRYWVGLKRDYVWQWADGSSIAKTLFRPNFETKDASDDLCASITSKGRFYWLQKLPCLTKLPFLCESEPKPLGFERSDRIDSTEIGLEVLLNDTDTETTTRAPTEDSNKELLQTILYLGIGIVSGVAFVICVCILVYFIRKCHKERMAKKSNSYRHAPRDNFSAFAADDAEAQSEDVGVPMGENESPFRRTQRLLREASIGSGSEGYRSNSWKRVQNGSHRDGRKIERPVMGCEIRNIYPSTERSFKDTSKAIHQVRAQYHGGTSGDKIDDEFAFSGSLDTRLRKPSRRNENDVTLADTYSLPPQSRKASENDVVFNMETGDLYACVQKAMARLSEDNLDQIENHPNFTT